MRLAALKSHPSQNEGWGTRSWKYTPNRFLIVQLVINRLYPKRREGTRQQRLIRRPAEKTHSRSAAQPESS